MEIIIALAGFAVGGATVGFFLFKKYSHLEIEAQTWKTKFELTLANAEQVRTAQDTLKLQFQDLAQKILDDKSAKMSGQLTDLLSPLKEKLKDFEKKVEDTYVSEQKDRSHLKGEISKLIELNQTMSKEAQNLTMALKGENKTQGNWGELILENILERSGLRKGEEYFTQGTLKGSDGETLRPDIIVNLPDNKCLIVDSKMTLLAYEASVSAETPAEKEKFAAAHVESLKNHINGLAKKEYHAAGNLITPDFVILFMPLEPAFALAFKLKPELFEQAWDKKVAIVSPTTLLTTLRTVSALWKQERQQKNALEIAKRGGMLYDKFALIVKDLENLGEKITSVQKAHTEVTSKFSSGQGNLISQVEKLKELGAKAEKSLPLIE